MKMRTLFFLCLVAMSPLLGGCDSQMHTPLSVPPPDGHTAFSVSAKACPDTIFVGETSALLGDVDGCENYTRAWYLADTVYSTSLNSTFSSQIPGRYDFYLKATCGDKFGMAFCFVVVIEKENPPQPDKPLDVLAYAVPPEGVVPFTSTLMADAEGGNGNYQYEWFDEQNVLIDTCRTTQVQIDATGTFLFTVKVRSGSQTAWATATATGTEPELPPPPNGCPWVFWTDATVFEVRPSQKQVSGTITPDVTGCSMLFILAERSLNATGEWSIEVVSDGITYQFFERVPKVGTHWYQLGELRITPSMQVKFTLITGNKAGEKGSGGKEDRILEWYGTDGTPPR